MTDVFLSYRKSDIRYVQRVSAALEAAGLATWWDEGINPTASWDQEIWRALKSAKTVLVLWTPAAVSSSFVIEEAERGAKSKKLVQALVEPCEIPTQFIGRKTGQQFYDIVDWRPGFESDGWTKLLDRLQDKCARKRGFFSQKSRRQVDERHWRTGILRADFLSEAPSGAIFADGEGLPEMVVVPAGSFLMGSPKDEESRRQDGREDPQRLVSISKTFAVSRFAMTTAQFANFVEKTGHRTDGVKTHWDGEKWDEAKTLWGQDAQRGTWRENPFQKGSPAERAKLPAILVSWDDAAAYCGWLSTKTGQNYRLLSEAEWEYCCRSGTNTPFYFGDTLSTLQANYNGSYKYGGKRGGRNREATVAVDALPPNDFGLYQMHGNVWEWVQDCYVHGYDAKALDGAPVITTEADYRCMRGGSWSDPPRGVRSACRGWAEPELRAYSVGFRIARDMVR